MVAIAETPKGFWHTAPGLITAVAALVTAIGGVVGILVQNDVLGPRNEGAQSGAAQGVEAGSSDDSIEQAGSGAATAGPSEPSTLVPWVEATATLVRRDGTAATVKAPTVGLACDTQRLAFENGQRISLEIVRSIDFEAIYTENSSADAVVTLLDGRRLDDPVHTWNCPVRGTTELGTLDIPLADIRRIEFHR